MVCPGDFATARQDQASTREAAAVPPTPTEVAIGEVGIRVETFGVGEMVRAGDWAGIRLALKDAADRPREVAVRLHLRDGDGDTTLHTRIITLNPGREMGTWLYARMPWDLAAGSVLRVSVAEATPDEDGVAAIGRQLSWRPIQASKVAPPQDALAYVVGTSALGLDQYSQVLRDRGIPPGAHELMHVVSGLSPEALPDQWTGLAAAEILLWSEGDPSSIMGDLPAQAVREWVHRGGHLVIVLPGVGSPWSGSMNPLADLMPTCRIDRLAEADLTPYRVLLSGTSSGDAGVRTPLHRFIIDGKTAPAEAMPILTGPHGVVAVRRIVGAGMVTVIGLDLTNRRIAQVGLIRADAFWARILGRRGATPTIAEVETMLSRGSIGRANAPEVWVDERIAGQIEKSREAGLGVLLGAVVFILYWGVAGPVGFWLMQRRGLERHAWVGFVAAAGVFTIVAWGGAQSLRPKREEAWHFTLIDHVYGQPVSRARSFVSVLLPTYGDQRVSLGEPETDERWSQMLTPWSDPASNMLPAFPDARAYEADVRRMSELLVPARSTIKTFQADWVGGPRWSMPVPASPDHPPTIDDSGRLSGALKHGMPGPIEKPRVILVLGQVADGMLGRTSSASPSLVARAYAWTLPDSWQPGDPLDLSVFQPDPQALASKRLSDLVPLIGLIDRTLPGSVKEDDLDDMMAFFGVLEQPELGRGGFGATRVPAMMRRRMTHTLDLSKWFTQPCLIIVGAVNNAPSPVPMAVDGLRLDGRERGCSGRTVVRWVYPLPPRPLVVGGGPGTLPIPTKSEPSS